MSRIDDIRRRCGGYGYWPLTMAQEDARWGLRWVEMALPILRWYADNCACACGGSDEMAEAAERLLEEVEGE